MAEPAVTIALDCRDLLGEGPVWSARHQALWWLDIKGQRLHRFDPQSASSQHWELPTVASALAVQDEGSLLLATASGLLDFDLKQGQTSLRQPLEPHLPHNRSNDGKCDPMGRFWCGTMDDGEQQRSGGLYRFDPDGSLSQHAEGIGISNTLAWSPDGSFFYFADSMEQEIYRYPFDLAAGTLGPRETFVSLRGSDASPDGSAMDREGYLWNCQWDGWRVVRYAPDGRQDAIVPLPVQRPTSCAFGGPDLQTLYITSARIGLSHEELQTQPHAGALLALPTDVAGAPVPDFGAPQED